jgi:hypothetical protein
LIWSRYQQPLPVGAVNRRGVQSILDGFKRNAIRFKRMKTFNQFLDSLAKTIQVDDDQ